MIKIIIFLKFRDGNQALGRVGPEDVKLTEEEWRKRERLMQQIRFIGGKDGAKLQPYSERKLKPLNSNKNVLVGDPTKKKIAGGRGNFLADLSNKLAVGPKKPGM